MDRKILDSYSKVTLALVAASFLMVSGASADREVLASPCLNLRSEPALAGSVIECLQEGSRVQVLELSADWARVSVESGEVGWVAAAFLGKEETDLSEVVPGASAPQEPIERQMPSHVAEPIERPVAAVPAGGALASPADLRRAAVELEIAREELDAFRALAENADKEWFQRYQKLLGERDLAVAAASQLEAQALELSRQLAVNQEVAAVGAGANGDESFKQKLLELEERNRSSEQALEGSRKEQARLEEELSQMRRQLEGSVAASVVEEIEQRASEAESARQAAVAESSILAQRLAELEEAAEQASQQAAASAEMAVNETRLALQQRSTELLQRAERAEAKNAELVEQEASLQAALAAQEAESKTSQADSETTRKQSEEALRRVEEQLAAVRSERDGAVSQQQSLRSQVEELEALLTDRVSRSVVVELESQLAQLRAQQEDASSVEESLPQVAEASAIEAEAPSEGGEAEGEGAEPPKVQFSVRDLPIEVTVPLYIQNWSKAWIGQDIENYLQAYSDAFRVPEGMTRGAWETLRKRRLEAPEFIELTLANVHFTLMEKEHVKVQFEQLYRSNLFADRVVKELEMVLTDDGWKIIRETVVSQVE